MEFGELVSGLSRRLGIELAVENGICSIDIDGMVVNLHDISELGVIFFQAEIGEAPPQGLEPLLVSMLEANHLFQATGGATISRDPETGRFHLCRCAEAANLDVGRFSELLEKFVNVLEIWRKMLADYRPEERTVAETVGGGMSMPIVESGFLQV